MAHCGKWMESRLLWTLVAAELLETVRRCQASLAKLSTKLEQQDQRPRTGAVDPEQASKNQRSLSRFLRNLQLLSLENEAIMNTAEILSSGSSWRWLRADTTRISCAQWSGASRNGKQPEKSGCWG